VKVIFTSSVALAMHRSAHDLSRRVVLKMLYPFSLREYAFFKHGREIASLSMKDIIDKKWERSAIESGAFFREYLQGGLMPFALDETDPFPLLANILNTVIYKDIARISAVAVEEMDIIARMVVFIGKSAVDGINYSSLSRNLGITKYKAEQYAALLEQAFILHRILPEGTGVLKEPKVVMALPYRLLYRSYEEAVGGLREDFFVESVKANGMTVRYLKSTRGEKTPDYVLQGEKETVFEIGGKGKGRSQFKGFKTRHKIILTDSYEAADIRRPLFLFGLLTNTAT
jgi:predicted AAA+ superfamily ATPase